MLSIGVDVFGGDNAPQAVLEGIVNVLPELPEYCSLHLYGPQESCGSLKDQYAQIELTPTSEYIGMSEHAVKALMQKPNSSLALGLRDLAQNKTQAFASAGHSGALMVGALQILGLQEHVLRPAVATFLPTLSGDEHLLIDVGANADCKPEQLLDFAHLGVQYLKSLAKEAPVVLLNTGTEPGKGRILHQNTYKLLKEDPKLHFEGNLEIRNLYHGPAKIIVTDGFTGNMVLKQTEAFYELTRSRDLQDDYLSSLNYENYGATPILGVKGKVMLAHGASSVRAIQNMILASARFAQANF